MNIIRIILSIIALFTISTTIVIGTSGCKGNGGGDIITPEFTGIGPPPIEVTISQVYADYLTNEDDADVKYGKDKLLFSEVEVEEIFGNYFQMGDALGAGELSYVKLSFNAGTAKFKLREEYFGVMQNIEEGYVLNIIGQSRGLQDGLLLIDDCWVESVKGDLGIGEELDFY
jgi:hypothetical protein